MIDSISTSAIRWQPCYRIVPSRFPPISLFEAVADPQDLDAVLVMLCANESHFINGAVISADDGFGA